MSIMIREYSGFTGFSSGHQKSPVSIAESATRGGMATNALVVDIEGIHEGPTRNFTRYMKEALKSSIKSWTHPYEKPLIMHHNEKDGETIGRIHRAEYREKGTLSGPAALLFTVSIPDEKAADQVKDGRLLTTSIGVIAHDIRCSCCGQAIFDENGCPEHVRGGVYDGEYAYWDIYEMEAKELSYVVVPSDKYAQNVKVYDQQEKMQLAESLQTIPKCGALPMDEAKIQELHESVDTLNAELETQATELSEAKATVATLTAEKESLTAELTEAKEATVKAQADLAEKTAELESEVALREAAETTVVQLKESAKDELVALYAGLRKAAGKAELSEAAIKTRSVDSLKDSITDLQVELAEGVKMPKAAVPPVVTNPTITESTTEIVKKEVSASNIDLEEGLASLFSSSAGHFLNK